MTKQIEVPDDFCETCMGTGVPTLHGAAFSRAEMDEDPGFAEDYFSGAYDTKCDYCNGKGRYTEEDLDRYQARMEYQAESAAYRMGM